MNEIKKFVKYVFVGVLITVLNTFLLVVMIDYWFVNTAVAGLLIGVFTFVFRYLLYRIVRLIT